MKDSKVLVKLKAGKPVLMTSAAFTGTEQARIIGYA